MTANEVKSPQHQHVSLPGAWTCNNPKRAIEVLYGFALPAVWRRLKCLVEIGDGEWHLATQAILTITFPEPSLGAPDTCAGDEVAPTRFV